MDNYLRVISGVEKANRDAFEREHNIQSYSQSNKFRSFLVANRLDQSGAYDHEEWYRTRDGFVIWITTPYGNYDEELLSNTIFGVPFVKTDCLYNGGHSYYKKFHKSTPINEPQYSKWMWDGKAVEPKCVCGNSFYKAKYLINGNTWGRKHLGKDKENKCLDCYRDNYMGEQKFISRELMPRF